MRYVVAGGAIVALILSASIASALQTGSMGALEAELQARYDALTGDLSKEQAKEKKGLEKLLAYFDAPSGSPATDAKLIAKITKGVAKLYAADQAVLDLATAGMDAFLAEVDEELANQQRAVNGMEDGYKGKPKAQAGVDAAAAAAAAAEGAGDVAAKGKLLGKAVKAALKNEKGILKAADAGGLIGHRKRFAVDREYENATSCTSCHTGVDDDIMMTGHWQWEGVAANLEGYEAEVHGKTDLINNFCIAIPSNEGRCTQCHIGYGWADDSFDFEDETAIDCLVCHDTTGSYSKDPKTAGRPAAAVDTVWVAMNVGRPSRTNCGACHFYAGGGDNVKHGDLASTLGAAPTADDDVHMGTDGGDMSCQDCHTQTDHGIAGMGLHSVNEGTVDCTDCHTGTVHTGNATIEGHLDTIACQTCHIPTFSRSLPTKVEWYWETAGDGSRVPVLDQWGKPDYDKMKGDFVWDKDVEPELMWFNGKWERMFIGGNDQHGGSPTVNDPVVMAKPVGSRDDAGSKIYPFKKMIGSQPADAGNDTVLVPHLFGLLGGANPYWVAYDWGLALAEGAAYAGQTYSGSYEFVPTVMYLALNHEIVSGDYALGAASCNDCHNGGYDWSKLGYTGDPMTDPRCIIQTPGRGAPRPAAPGPSGAPRAAARRGAPPRREGGWKSFGSSWPWARPCPRRRASSSSPPSRWATSASRT